MEEAGNAYNETFLPITTGHYPFLSGTPFRAINSGEFIENQIYNWTYSDEQRAKESWVGSGNPYLSLPRMVMLTYRIPDSIRQIAMQGEFNEFDLNVFFSAVHQLIRNGVAAIPNGEVVGAIDRDSVALGGTWCRALWRSVLRFVRRTVPPTPQENCTQWRNRRSTA